MMRPLSTAILVLILTCAAFGQYKSEPAGAPPSELSAPIAAALQKEGVRISNNGAAYCEIWLVAKKPAAGSTEEGATLTGVPQGALLGAIRFTAKGSDRRGQNIKAGVYTLRYSVIPVNGDHQGAAPQRDFVLLTPAADDKDANATPNFDALVAMSKKASGTPHPAVLSLWKASDSKAGISQQGEDWVLQANIGDMPVAIILIGAAAS